MNEYKIFFSLFPINKDIKSHFSNCKATIEGNTYEEAMEKFKEKKKNEGWIVAFEGQGDGAATITLISKADKEKVIKIYNENYKPGHNFDKYKLDEVGTFFNGYTPIRYFNYDNTTKSNLFN